MSGPPAHPTLAAFLAALALPCVAAAQNPTLLAAPDPDGVLWHDARALFPVMVVTPEPFDSTRTYPAVVMLHGLGGASARFGASPAVKALTDAGFIAILPESPYAMASSAQGGHFSWDLIGSNDPPLVRDPVLQFRSVELFVLDHFPAALGRVRERYRLAPVYAFGFSKGADFALLTGFYNRNEITGIVTFGLGAFDAAWFTARGETLADGRDMPILLVHGTADQLAPLAVAERARDALAAAEWEVTLRSFEGGHTMPVEEVAFAVEWLRKSVAAQTPARPGSAPKVLAGTFAPSGPPARPPVRVAAGDGCVVDLQQAYIVSGDLAGSARIDYRILVEGPCGPPPGTFAEEWIAHGTFTGTLNGTAASARLRYTARVQPGGEVDGRIVLGQGLAGELRVQGNFGDSRLSYSGRVERD